MGFLINDRKLKAALGSLHQFCHAVREIFPGEVDDRVVEASTAYLYMSLVHDLFGSRFASKLQKKLHSRLKYSNAAEIEGHIARISKHSEGLEKGMDDASADRSAEEIVRAHVLAVIEAMLCDAGFKSVGKEQAARAYIQFERAIKEMRSHLVGIKEQNHFLMKTRNVA
ncbi:MAG: hypothetical protein IID28_10480 [Planctomycetes bacterium]|nr:hypothetical protein [Planctomycetota bacterium]